ncbi:MAG: hypothetical protein AB1894_15990 [Chloroflexota bacterium]
MNKTYHKLTLDRPATYQIKVPGHLEASCLEFAGSMQVTCNEDRQGLPVTVLTGEVDQAALQSVLRQLYSLGLPLISVTCLDTG